MRILVTGATGFVGSYLIEHLVREGGHELHGLARRLPADRPTGNGQIAWHAADLERADGIDRVLEAVRPEWIFHLAGYSNTGRSFREPELAWVGNWQATFNLYLAVARVGMNPRILFTSSGLIYGQREEEGGSFAETDPLQPASPYASSKAAADLLSYQITRHPGLDVVRVRCFNQIGPRQSADYATANFARQIAAILDGRQPRLIETGDLSGRRDLTDVRDMVRAFVLLMKSGKTGEAYNAGSGTIHTMQSVLDRMLHLSGASIEVRPRVDADRRPDVAVCRADISKLQKATGWRPEISLDQSLRDLLNYWHTRV